MSNAHGTVRYRFSEMTGFENHLNLSSECREGLVSI